MGRDDESGTVVLCWLQTQGRGAVWDNGDKPSHSYRVLKVDHFMVFYVVHTKRY